MNNYFSALILASGTSERMGSPKALLKYNNSFTFIEQLITVYKNSGAFQIICVINNGIDSFCKNLIVPDNITFITNNNPEWGRMYSIKLGLDSLSSSSYCFIQNVDNPFITEEIIKKIYFCRTSNSWVSPLYNNVSGHPVLLPYFIVQRIITDNNLNTTLHEILKEYEKINVKMDDDIILRNINTPEEYLSFFGEQIK